MKSQRIKALVHTTANCNNYNTDCSFQVYLKLPSLTYPFLTYMLESQYGALSNKITSCLLYGNTICYYCLQVIIKEKNYVFPLEIQR